MASNDSSGNHNPAVSAVKGKTVDKRGARFLPKMKRLPTLEDLARRSGTNLQCGLQHCSPLGPYRIVPGAAGAAESNATTSTEAQLAEAPGPRPRLSTSILSHRSQKASVTNIDVPAPEGSSLANGSDSTLVAPQPGEEPPKDLAKDKIYRGYKNVPSLDAITERMRARAGSSSETPVSSATTAIAKISINAPADDVTVTTEQTASSSKSDTAYISTTGDAKPTQEKAVPPPILRNEKSPETVDDNTHPLQFAWTLYHDSRGRSFPPAPSAANVKSPLDDNEHYAAGLTVIGNFETVEDFCRYFNWLKPPSLLEAGSNYHLFKKGIQPMWEDAANANVRPGNLFSLLVPIFSSSS